MAPSEFRHGFRHDPMAFVENDESLQGAVVRRVVFGRTRPGDEELIEGHLREVFTKQNPDGSLQDRHDQGVLAATGEELLGLLEMGCSPDRPGMQRAIGAVREAVDALSGDEAADISCYSLRVLCELGVTEPPAVTASLLKTAAEIEAMFGEGCPWTPFVQLNALWAGREVADVTEAIETALVWAEDAVEPPGCSSRLGLCVPWSLVLMVGVIDHPAAGRIARKLVPMLLRLQKRDGGWGESERNATLRAFLVLMKYGLLDELRALPPLPPDWTVVREIPSPAVKPGGLAWDGERLWVQDWEPRGATAVSPEDGRVLKTVALPAEGQLSHIGVWDGALAVAVAGENAVLNQIDPDTGAVRRQVPLGRLNEAGAVAQVDGHLLVSDCWNGGVLVIDPDRPEATPRRTWLACSQAVYMSSSGDDIWAFDAWAPAVVRTNTQGDLLDWGEKPFGWGGIAFDGEHLWALDPRDKRICVIEKSDTAPRVG